MFNHMAMMTCSIGRYSLPRLAAVAAILLAGCATPHFDVDEAIRFQDGRTRFVAFAQNKTGWVLRGVSDVEVRFIVDGQEVATAVTDERGFAKAIATIEKPAERFEAKANLGEEEYRSEAEVVEWRNDRVIVACDIDATISDTSLGALFFGEFDESSTAIEGSLETLAEIDRDFHVVYLTARPRFTLEKTRHWLDLHGYPRAPVITSLTVRDALGQTSYKTMTLNSIRKHYTNLLIGIGNTDIDAVSYAAHGMLVLLVQPDEDPIHVDSIVRFQSWQQISDFFRDNRELLLDPERVQAAARGEATLKLPQMH
jgi:hypothetical protein